ncbi:MAG: HAD family phosphatase [Deltaproteobacteria bacterium]|nr:HAD family phosphatase [Deltaproteobacteria bacterium]
MSPRVLLLDVMGTLVHDPFYVEVPASLGMSLDELIAVKHPRAWVDFELGHIDEPTFLSRFFADERQFDGEGLRDAMDNAYRYLPGIEALLQELRSGGVPMHALSNYPPWYALIERRLSLSRYLKWSFVSCELGLRKPDPAIYEHAAKTLGLPPTACVFVDDRADNCDAARATGMDAVCFTAADALREALVGRGLL